MTTHVVTKIHPSIRPSLRRAFYLLNVPTFNENTNLSTLYVIGRRFGNSITLIVVRYITANWIIGFSV